MIVTCVHCSHQLYLDDSKIPEGAFKVRCTKCSKIITAERKHEAIEDISPVIQQYVKSQIDAVRQEFQQRQAPPQETVKAPTPAFSEEDEDAEIRRALICESEPATLATLSSVAQEMGFIVETANTANDALKKIESGIYALVIVGATFPDDKDGSRKIVGRINGQKSSQRRQTFLVMISPQHKTGDYNAAFILGANWIVHKSDVANISTAIAEGQQHYRQLYSLFNRVLAERDEHI